MKWSRCVGDTCVGTGSGCDDPVEPRDTRWWDDRRDDEEEEAVEAGVVRVAEAGWEREWEEACER